MFYDFYGFLAVSHYFDNFYSQKRLIWQIMDLKNLKSLSAVFVRFLAVFHYFADFYWPNRLIWQVMDYGNLKNRQTANMAVFRRFLCGFCRFLSDFPIFSSFLPTKPANYENYV